MSKNLEIERTYLAKYLPAELKKLKFDVMEDIYIPKKAKHSRLRIRRIGDNFFINKKTPLKNKDSSVHKEEIIKITEDEFNSLRLSDSNVIKKIRYYYPFNEIVSEIDVFLGKLKGLVLVDFEFSSYKEMSKFKIPDFCLADVTNEEFIAGGVLCRSSFKSLEPNLLRFKYKKVLI